MCHGAHEVGGAASQTALLTKAGRFVGSQVSTVRDTWQRRFINGSVDILMAASI